MEALRTPDERFRDLPGFDFSPHYVEVDGLRVHYLDEGPADGEPVLLMHGEPSWCYLYRDVIPILTAAGYRALAPDLIGFGRSDKPVRREDYTFASHAAWMRSWLDAVDPRGVTVVGQDWGGMVGLRLLADEPDRFARAVASNTGLPTGDHETPEAFFAWQRFSQTTPEFHVGGIVKGGCLRDLEPEVVAAYDAPFPDDRYKAGARQFPMLVPTSPDHPSSESMREVWRVLTDWHKPFLTAFSDSDPITRGADRVFQKVVPGARGETHVVINGAGHFVQEDKGAWLAKVIVDFIGRTPR